MESYQYIAGLIVKELKGAIDPYEKEFLTRWVQESFENQRLYNELTDSDHLKVLLATAHQSRIRVEQKVFDKIRPKSGGRVLNSWVYWAAAAVVCLLIGTTGYLLWQKHPVQPAETNIQLADIAAPQTSRAVIVLSDGQEVYLDTLHQDLILPGNARLVKPAKDRLAYKNVNGTATNKLQYNLLLNPRGSKVISVQLSDGTNVWLNAGSSLRYPVAFASDTRNVKLEGEGYFEVFKDPARKFIVQTGTTFTQVLGTHFNINSYKEEEDIKITLLEGRVNVTRGLGKQVLNPGQQAIVKGNTITRKDAINIDAVMAWKYDRFDFGDAISIETIMRQLARWYDIDVVYQGKITSRFGGSISRNENLSKVLAMLQATGSVKFKITDKKVTVMP